jgi:hypothetical protein
MRGLKYNFWHIIAVLRCMNWSPYVTDEEMADYRAFMDKHCPDRFDRFKPKASNG